MSSGCIDVPNQRVREFKGLIILEQGENAYPKRAGVASNHANDDVERSADIDELDHVSGLGKDVLKAQFFLVELRPNLSRSVGHILV